MAESNDEFRSEFTTWFYDQWNTATSNAPLAFDNMPEPTGLKSAPLWGRLHIKEQAGGQISLGGGQSSGANYRHTGTVYVQIFVPAATGLVDVGAVAKTLAEAIEDTGHLGNVWFRDTQTREVGIEETKAWFQFNVETGFVYDRAT